MSQPSEQEQSDVSWSETLFDSLCRESVSWIGIGGAIVTLLSGIQDFIKLAQWAAVLVDNFSQITLWFWSHLLFFLPKVSPLTGWLLNLVAFFTSIAVTSVRRRVGDESYSGAPNAWRDIGVGIGLVVILGLAFASLRGLYASGALSARDLQFLTDAHTWLGGYVPARFIYVVGALLVILPLVGLMNGLGWAARVFDRVVDQRLAMKRIWRINLGVVLVLILSEISRAMGPLCAQGGPLSWLCG